MEFKKGGEATTLQSAGSPTAEEQRERMRELFLEGLSENDTEKLLRVPKSDLHNHSTKGCRRAWLSEQLKIKLPEPPERFEGLAGMQEWFTTFVKPFCAGKEGGLIRWEGAFAEAARNNIKRLSMKPELTYVSCCDTEVEAARIEQYISDGFFRSVDVCGGEDVKPVEAFVPLYRKAEQYGLMKRMHVGESGSAEDVRRAVEVLGLSEVHHGIHAAESDEVMRFLADNRIQLNVCPSSNVKLGYADSYKDHPIKLLYENGVQVTVNTDDLLIFDSSVENEYLLLYQAGTLTANQLNEIRESALTGEISCLR